MTLFVKLGSFLVPKLAYAKLGGTWQSTKKLWVKSDGVWKLVYPTPGSVAFASSGAFVVPNGVTQALLSAIGGGASAGNVVDGGRNDDFGGSGGGSSGQRCTKVLIPLVPGETVTVSIGGGSRAYGGRDSANQGGSGGTTYIYTSNATYYLLGGVGGYGGVGGEGNQYPGGSQTTSNSSLTVNVSQGGSASGGYGGSGGAGTDIYGNLGSATPGGRYGGGNSVHNELNAAYYGGGGAGAYSTYIREDNGNSPCWGGLGQSGAAYIEWGDI